MVKTSSLGDVIHNLPALSDLRRHFPDAVVDWCVEEGFAAVPRLHPGIGEVVPVAVRRWRKRPFAATTWREIGACRARLRGRPYDLAIDTQGLMKSALLTRWAKGLRVGYAPDSAREPLASLFYDQRLSIARDQHAVDRNRQLVAAALGYTVEGGPDYGITAPPAAFGWLPDAPYAVLLTATSRDDKLWPESHWLELGGLLSECGLCAVLPAGSAAERERAARLAERMPDAVAAPPLDIAQLASLLAGARAAVGVDTGLTHLAVALEVPTLALYTATDPGLTGVLGAGFFRNLGGKGQIPSPSAVMDELRAVPGP